MGNSAINLAKLAERYRKYENELANTPAEAIKIREAQERVEFLKTEMSRIISQIDTYLVATARGKL